MMTTRVQISDLELDQQAAGMVEETTSFDYVLKEIRFITTGGRSEPTHCPSRVMTKRVAVASLPSSSFSGTSSTASG